MSPLIPKMLPIRTRPSLARVKMSSIKRNTPQNRYRSRRKRELSRLKKKSTRERKGLEIAR